MSLGEVVYLSDSKILIPNHLLAPMCISPESVVHCMQYHPKSCQIDNNKIDHPVDLLLTPINPDYWPFTFRLSMQVAHEIGSMNSILEVLSSLDEDINILFTRSYRSGHEHGTWVMYCVVEPIMNFYLPTLKRIMDDRGLEPEPKQRKLENILKLVACEMRKFLHNSPKIKISPGHDVAADGIIKHIEDKCGDAVWKNFENQIGLRAVNAMYLSSLANYYSRRVYARKVPSLTAERGAINFAKEENKSIFVELKNRVQLPTIGIATGDRADCTIRVNVIERDRANNFYRFHIKYSRSHKNSIKKSSKELLKNITSSMKENELNIWSSSNMMFDDRYKSEFGKISLVVEDKKANSPADKTQINNWKEDVAGAVTNTFKPLFEPEIKISQLGGNVKIFVSMKIFKRRDFSRNAQVNYDKFVKRKADILYLIYEIGKEYAFDKDNFDVIHSNTENVIDKVIKSVQNSDAMLQLYVKFDQSDKNTFSKWFDGEYFAAKARNIFPVRIIDEKISETRYNKNTVVKDIDPDFCNMPTSDQIHEWRYIRKYIEDEEKTIYNLLLKEDEEDISQDLKDRIEARNRHYERFREYERREFGDFTKYLRETFEKIWEHIREGKSERWKIY